MFDTQATQNFSNTDGNIKFVASALREHVCIYEQECVRFVCLAMGWWEEACGGHLEGLELSGTSSATNYSVSTLHCGDTKCARLCGYVYVCLLAKQACQGKMENEKS